MASAAPPECGDVGESRAAARSGRASGFVLSVRMMSSGPKPCPGTHCWGPATAAPGTGPGAARRGRARAGASRGRDGVPVSHWRRLAHSSPGSPSLDSGASAGDALRSQVGARPLGSSWNLQSRPSDVLIRHHRSPLAAGPHSSFSTPSLMTGPDPQGQCRPPEHSCTGGMPQCRPGADGISMSKSVRRSKCGTLRLVPSGLSGIAYATSRVPAHTSPDPSPLRRPEARMCGVATDCASPALGRIGKNSRCV